MFTAKMIILTLFLPCIVACALNNCNRTRRIFPAAQVEEYSKESSIFGAVNVSSVQVVSFGPKTTVEFIDFAIDRFSTSLHHLPDYATDYKINPGNHTLHELTTIEIHISSDDVDLVHGVNENYTLAIEDGQSTVIIVTETVFGALRALESFGQLLEFGWLDDDDNPIFIVHDIPIWVEDFPAYAYRGLLIDTSRHFLPVDLILANLDVMLMNKLNILNWHITDSQSFPYVIETMPELSNEGAYHPKLVYSRKDIQRIIREAYLRGIRVIPEVDMPGHTKAVAASHPELMSNCPYPTEPLDPTKSKVYQFIRSVYQDLKEVFVDEFIHVGGDEVDLSCWSLSRDITDWMREHNMSSSLDLFEMFETKLLEIVDQIGRTPIVWQEVFNLNLTLTTSTIIDVWKGNDMETIQEATSRGFEVILSGCWYLDHLNSDWQKFYSCNPGNFTTHKDLLIGGHASMWGEHVDASNFMSRVWPRASAAAERLWTGSISSAEKNVNQRISIFRCRMVQQGFLAEPIGPGFCAHEVPCKIGSRVKNEPFGFQEIEL